MATAIAQPLTRMELVVCRALSLAAISRLRSLLSPVGSVTAQLLQRLWLQATLGLRPRHRLERGDLILRASAASAQSGPSPQQERRQRRAQRRERRRQEQFARAPLEA